MTLTLIFWAILAVPGDLIADRLFPEERAPASTGFGRLSLAYLCSFGVFAPFLVAAYWLSLPLWSFSALIATTVVASLGLWLRAKRWRNAKLPGAMALLAGAAIAADAALYAVHGAYLDGDAAFHLARVRMLLDHGFNNADPYLYPPQFSWIYHTNAYHAFLAAASQLTQQSQFQIWSSSIAWCKLVTVSSAYYLAWHTFRNRIGAWTSALAATFFVYNALPIDGALRWTYLVLPHNFAPLWLLPMALVATMQLWRAATFAAALKLGFSILVLSQLHNLYAVFAVILVAPVMLLRMLAGLWQQRTARLPHLLALLFLLIPFGFHFAGLYGGASARKQLQARSYQATAVDRALKPLQQGRTKTKSHFRSLSLVEALNPRLAETYRKAETKKRTRKLRMVRLDDKRLALDVKPLVSFEKHRIWLILSILLALGAGVRQSYMLCYAAAFSTLLLFHPTLFTLLVNFSGLSGWAVARMDVVLAVTGYALLPNTVPAIFSARKRVAQSLQVAIFVALLGYGLYHYARHGFYFSAKKGRTSVRGLETQAQLLQRQIPQGSIVLAGPVEAKRVVQLHDVYVVAANRMSPNLLDANERREHLATILNPKVPQPQRYRLLRKYGISYVVTRDRSQFDRIQKMYAPALTDIKQSYFTTAKLSPERLP